MVSSPFPEYELKGETLCSSLYVMACFMSGIDVFVGLRATLDLPSLFELDLGALEGILTRRPLVRD